MNLLYKYYWIFPIFSFLLPLIGLPLPVVIFKIPDNGSYIVDGSITLWGTYYGNFPDTFDSGGFIDNTLITISSNACSWAIIISSFIVPGFTARSIKRKEKMEKGIFIRWISIASLFVSVLIYWSIMINNTIGTVMPPAFQDTNFWKYFRPGAGFYTLLTSAGFIIIGAFLYWKRLRESGKSLMIQSEIPMIEKPDIQEQKMFEIKEDLELGAFWVTFTMMIVLTFWILITTAIFFAHDVPFLLYLIIIPILWGGFFYVLHKVLKYMRGSTEIRTLTITENKIEIQFPRRPVFHVNWDKFDSIEINERWEILRFPRNYGKGIKIYYINIIFKTESAVLTNFEISLFELKSKTLCTFINKLYQCASKKNKNLNNKSSIIRKKIELYN
ncbi:MAG: hypothetical protein ACFFFT_15820 [Candidatus Thorarchaeota archaeon]